MLDLTQIDFYEKPSEELPGVKIVGGRLKITDEVTLRPDCTIPMSVIHDSIRNRIWHTLYGEFISPLAELEHIALTNAVSAEDYEKVSDLCIRLENLIELSKNPPKQITTNEP